MFPPIDNTRAAAITGNQPDIDFFKAMGGHTIGWRLFQGSFLVESGILITA